MDDDLEDEIVHEIFWAHVKILSRVRVDLSGMVDTAAFYARIYMFRPGIVAVAFALIAGILLCHSTDVWFNLLMRRLELLKKSGGVNRDKIKLLVNSPSRNDRRSWELQDKSAGVFALQGRRPRMEDRFCILNDEVHDIHLYGVFDGHGGEVWSWLISTPGWKVLNRFAFCGDRICHFLLNSFFICHSFVLLTYVLAAHAENSLSVFFSPDL